MKMQGGTDWFQQIAFMVIEMQIAADSLLIFNLPYLLLFPKLRCVLNGEQIEEGTDDYL